MPKSLCPNCERLILAEARVCPFCSYDRKENSVISEEREKKLGEFADSLKNLEQDISEVNNLSYNITNDVNYDDKERIQPDIKSLKRKSEELQERIQELQKDAENLEALGDRLENAFEQHISELKKDLRKQATQTRRWRIISFLLAIFSIFLTIITIM